MASLLRRTYTKIDPATGAKVRHKAKRWYIQYRDANGIIRRAPGFTDKEATRQLAAQLEKQAALKAVGVVDRFAEHRKRPLAGHLEDFSAALTSKGNTKAYVDLVTARVRKALDGSAFKLLGDLDASKFSSWLGEQRKAGLSNQTATFYVSSMKSFCRWLVRSQRMAESPLAHLGGFNASTDRRHDRRALSQEELARLLDAARVGETRQGLAGPDRAMLYLVAANTGLRASELRSLTPASFDFTSDPATVTLEAGYSKHRRKDVLPMRGDLAERLAAWIGERKILSLNPSQGSLWPGSWNERASELVQHDLEAAGIEYRDASGRFADFHAFRHTLLSSLAQSGAHPKATQSLARHSTITLTMDRYSHLGLVDMKKALDGLPALPSATAASESAKATGTDGQAVENAPKKLALPLALTADFSCRDVALSGNPEMSGDNAPLPQKAVPGEDLAHVGAPCPESSKLRRVARAAEWAGFENRCSGSATPGTDKPSDATSPSLALPLAPDSGKLPPDLARVVSAWPSLPEHIRAAIAALVATTAPMGPERSGG